MCSDEQIINASNEFLIKLFGKKWFKYYSIVKVHKNKLPFDSDYYHRSKIKLNHAYNVTVEYSFSGPGNLKSLSYDYLNSNGSRSAGVGPWLHFHLNCRASDDCGQLVLSYGHNIVPPYDVSKLITAQEATKTANEKGYKVLFSSLDLVHAS